MEVDLSDFPTDYYPDLVVKAQNNNFNCLCFSHEMRRRKSVVECGSENVVNGAIIRDMEGEEGSIGVRVVSKGTTLLQSFALTL